LTAAGPGDVGVLPRIGPDLDKSQRLADGVTFGVEEEFLLVDRRSLRVAPRAPSVLALVPEAMRAYLRRELLDTQVEVATPVCHGLPELRAELVALRRGLAAAAEHVGCRLVAVGAAVLPGTAPKGRWVVGRSTIPSMREKAMRQRFGAAVDRHGLSACHVHVGLGDLDLAVAVSNHVRAWLPVLQAMSANSPFADGRDTGYASWRSVLWARRPTAGPPPWLHSAVHFNQLVDSLLGSGAMLDRATLFWYARPSAVHPTIELRVGDVCATVDETVLVAALARALVRTAMYDVQAGRTPPFVEDQLLAAAHWTAARFGLDGELFDPVAARPRPAWDMVHALADHVRPALVASSDLETVHTLCDVIRAGRSSAARQREAYSLSRDPRAVVRHLIDQTLGTGTE
jgi:carboxylate-amine ligase